MKKIIIILTILLVIGIVIIFAMNSGENSTSTNYNNIEQLDIEDYSLNGADLIAEIANKMIDATR